MPDIVIVSEAGTVTIVDSGSDSLTIVDGTGTVYGVSVVSANGFAGSVAKDTTLPAITLSTSINGLLAGDGTSIFAATAGTGLSYDDITGILTNSEPDQTVVLTDGTDITITGTYPSFTIAYSGTGGAFLPLAGGTMTGAITFGTGSQYISKGNFDTSRGGSSGISLVCAVGFEFNWQAGWLTTTADGTTTPRPLYLDSLAGTTLRAWNASTSTGTEVDHLGITFADTTVQTTAYTGGAGVSSLTAGTGISLDLTTGDIAVTNSEPDQIVTLTNGTDISVTGTYPSFTIAYSGSAGSGTVTSASVVSANGFAGSVATDTTTPAITITTTITGLLIGNGTSGAISAATAGTDYVIPSGSITGNASTVTTNANLTGVITSTGNATVIASQTGTGTKFVVDTSPTLVTPTLGVATATTVNKITVTQPATGATLTIANGAILTASATASVSGTNTGDNATNTTYSSLVSNATHTGDATGSTALTVVKINGVLMSGLGTGILKNTTTTGVPSIATAGTDYVVPAGALGTPSSGTLTSCTGLPIATGVSGLATGVATFLATPTSANLKSAITDESGAGSLVFTVAATLFRPIIYTVIEVKTAPVISAGVLALDCNAGNVFHVSLNAAITSITFSNIPTTGNAYGLTLAFTADGTARSVTWPAAVIWSGGTAPTLTSTLNKVDIFVLTTWDAGTTWYSMVGGQNF